MNQVSAGTDVDTGVGGLHTREVELRAWGGERLVQVQLYESPSRTDSWDRTGGRCVSTLMPLLSSAGQGPPVLTGPVEVVRWTPTDLAPQ